MTTAIGIDLSGPSNFEDTAVALLEKTDDRTRRVADWSMGASDVEILDGVRRASERSDGDELVVGLDAPLSYNPGGGLRPADRALRGALADRDWPVDSVMPPTMTRMVYLTVRGMSVARLLEGELEVRILEVHPTSALYFRSNSAGDVQSMKQSETARKQLVAALDVEAAPTGEVADSDHLVAALAAARAAADWADGQACWSYDAEPPAHPYPLVC